MQQTKDTMPATATTEWRPIPGWEDLYDVSDDGRVYSRRSALALKTGLAAHLYPQVGLCREGRRHYSTVHRLVLLAFVGPCPDGGVACHGDGDPENNTLSNLRWGTPLDNAQDRDMHGTTARGRAVNTAVLSAADVLSIRAEYALGGVTHSALASKYAVGRRAIGRVVRGETWSHIGGPRAQRHGRDSRPQARGGR